MVWLLFIVTVAALAAALVGWWADVRMLTRERAQARLIRQENARLAAQPLELVQTSELVQELQVRHDVSFVFAARKDGEAKVAYHGPAIGLFAVGSAVNATMDKITEGKE
jgi:hypothetical protein